MSSGIKQVVQIAPETTVNTTPSPFDRTTLEFTDCTLDQKATTTESATIKDSRISSGTLVTGFEYAGDLTIEGQFAAADELFAAAAYNEWDNDVLTFGGTLRKTFSILRGFKDVADYHIFSGVHVNQLDIDIPDSGIVTFKFGLMGMGRAKATVVPAGVVTAATSNPKITTVQIGSIKIDGSVVPGVCLTQAAFSWNNNAKVQKCLGSGTGIGAILETLAAGTGNFTAAWSTNTSGFYEKQFTNTPISLEIPILDTLGNKYILSLPEVNVTASLPTGKNSDILTTQFSYTAANQAPTLTRVHV